MKGAAGSEGILLFTLKESAGLILNLNRDSLADALYGSLKRLSPVLKLVSVLEKQPSVSHQGLKDKHRAPAPLPRSTWTLYPNTLRLRC